MTKALKSLKESLINREFPDGPVVRTWQFHCWGPGSILGQGIRIMQATQHGQKKKKKIINKYPGFYDIVEKDKQPGRKISKTLFYKRHANGY